jgi:hypothetical protein
MVSHVSTSASFRMNETPANGMKKYLPYLSIAYLIYALVVAFFVGRLLVQFYQTYSVQAVPLSSAQWVPLVVFVVISVAFISMFFALAYFLSTRRRRRAILIMAGITCVGIPVGTILGGLTIYALTRPEISSEFAS